MLDYPIAKTVHNVHNRQGCNYAGGYWDDGRGFCMMDEVATSYTEAGWTAPIHGVYFWYELTDDPGWSEKPYIGVTGCLVNDSPDYPGSPGSCAAIYNKEFSPRRYNYPGDEALNHFEQLVRDAMHLNLEKYGLVLVKPPKERLKGIPDKPFIGYPGIIEDFKKGWSSRIVPFRIRGGR